MRKRCVKIGEVFVICDASESVNIKMRSRVWCLMKTESRIQSSDKWKNIVSQQGHPGPLSQPVLSSLCQAS